MMTIYNSKVQTTEGQNRRGERIAKTEYTLLYILLFLKGKLFNICNGKTYPQAARVYRNFTVFLDVIVTRRSVLHFVLDELVQRTVAGHSTHRVAPAKAAPVKPTSVMITRNTLIAMMGFARQISVKIIGIRV
jgi:hypothetical protein